MRAEQITDPVAYHGEGPVWSEGWGGLCWVDMLAGDVLSMGGDGLVKRRHVGTIAAAIRPRRQGGAVIGLERGFALEDAEGSLTYLGDIWDDPNVRMNEGGCDPDGRFYCGSMTYDHRPGAGSLYRLDPDGSVVVALESVTISNGLAWTPDGSAAYYADTETHRIDRFEYEPGGGLRNRRTFVDLTDERARPDGLSVDAEGNVWVALNGSGVVRCYAPDGSLEDEVEVPVTKVTACTFGGPELRDLFITTSREGLSPDQELPAGSLFRAKPNVSGLPVREFIG